MLLLDALACKNKHRPPIWLMRQAGRYLPEYHKFKEKQSLLEMFHDPKTIVEVTHLPFKRLDLDAAILFSDIMTVLNGLGIPYTFDPGPKITFNGFNPKKNAYTHIETAIHRLKQELDVPLLGFAGAPFTILSYFPKQLDDQHAALQKITDETITYLKLQIDSGVDAVQLFESSANNLSDEQFATYCLPYLKQIVDSIDAPVILFARGKHAHTLATLKPAAISLDWNYDLPQMRKQIDPSIALQGNLDPAILYKSQEKIKEALDRLLEPMKNEPGYIFNLGHGLRKDTPVENVEFLTNYVRSR